MAKEEARPAIIGKMLKLQAMVDECETELASRKERLVAFRKEAKVKGYCPLTGDRHVYVTFNSAAPNQRLQCADCGSFARVEEDFMTAPHGRSKLGG